MVQNRSITYLLQNIIFSIGLLDIPWKITVLMNPNDPKFNEIADLQKNVEKYIILLRFTVIFVESFWVYNWNSLSLYIFSSINCIYTFTSVFPLCCIVNVYVETVIKGFCQSIRIIKKDVFNNSDLL